MNDQIEISTVRVVRDPANRDGWSVRILKTDKLGFIHNLADVLPAIEPGQLWEAEVIQDNKKFNILKLTHCIKA